MKRLIHRMNQTAHISLQYPSMSKNVETKLNEMRPFLLARPASLTSDIIVASLLWIVTLGPSDATNQRLSAAGEGGSRVTTENPQPLFR